MFTVITSYDCPNTDDDDVEYNGVTFLNVYQNEKDQNDVKYDEYRILAYACDLTGSLPFYSLHHTVKT